MITDPTGTIVFWSTAAEQVFQAAAEATGCSSDSSSRSDFEIVTTPASVTPWQQERRSAESDCSKCRRCTEMAGHFRSRSRRSVALRDRRGRRGRGGARRTAYWQERRQPVLSSTRFVKRPSPDEADSRAPGPSQGRCHPAGRRRVRADRGALCRAAAHPMTASTHDEATEQARALGDPDARRDLPLRRRSIRPGRCRELTDHFGLNHNTIRQHLAKLRDAGLVVEELADAVRSGRPRSATGRTRGRGTLGEP